MKNKLLFAMILIFLPILAIFAGCDNAPTKYKLQFIVENSIYYTLETNGNEYLNFPPNPTKEGYKFENWYLDKEFSQIFTQDYLLNTKLDKNLIVYAKFQLVENDTTNLGLQYAPCKGGYAVISYIGTASKLIIPETYNNEKVVALGVDDKNIYFYGNHFLTSIEMPDTILYISDYAFYKCNNLVEVKMSKNLLEIGEKAFYGCTKLKTITIPNSVEKVGRYSFYNCRSVEKLYYNAISCDDLMFWYQTFAYLGYDTNGVELIIGENVKKLPRNLFASCAEFLDLPIGSNGSFVAPSGMAVVGGELVLTLTTASIKDALQEFTFCSSNINKITYNCKKNLNLGAGAFSGCNGLVNITIPNCVTNIGAYAFDSCNSLASVSFENANIWKVNSTYLSSSDLANKSTAAIYLKHTYSKCDWLFIGNQLIVNFYNGNDIFYIDCVEVNGYISSPSTIPTKDDYMGYGYTFSHWSLNQNGDEFDFDTKIENETNLYAVYTSSIKSYSITYRNTKGAENSNKTTYTYFSDTFTLENIQLAGYEFCGWFKDSEFHTSITQINKGSYGDLNIFAKWESTNEVIDIDTCDELRSINLDGNYRLICDISLSNTDWTPIGSRFNPFTGTFDGNGHTIRNINNSLFGAISETACVCNLIIDGIIRSEFVSDSIGVLTRVNYGFITNCKVTNINLTNEDYVNCGGIIGTNYGVITSSYSNGTINGGNYVGGIVGYNNGGIVEECTSYCYIQNAISSDVIIGYNNTKI